MHSGVCLSLSTPTCSVSAHVTPPHYHSKNRAGIHQGWCRQTRSRSSTPHPPRTALVSRPHSCQGPCRQVSSAQHSFKSGVQRQGGPLGREHGVPVYQEKPQGAHPERVHWAVQGRELVPWKGKLSPGPAFSLAQALRLKARVQTSLSNSLLPQSLYPSLHLPECRASPPHQFQNE